MLWTPLIAPTMDPYKYGFDMILLQPFAHKQRNYVWLIKWFIFSFELVS